MSGLGEVQSGRLLVKISCCVMKREIRNVGGKIVIREVWFEI